MCYKVMALILFMMVAIINLFSVKHNYKIGKILSKPLLMPMLLLFYCSSVSSPSIYIISALICGFIGDVFLMAEGIYVAIGGAAFLAGHIFYSLAFLKLIGFSQIPAGLYVFVLPYLFIAIYIGMKIKTEKKVIRYAVYTYVLFISAMSFCSLIALWLGSKSQLLISFIGSILFMVSDSMIALNTFHSFKKYSEFYIMLTYIVAQFFIVLGYI